MAKVKNIRTGEDWVIEDGFKWRDTEKGRKVRNFSALELLKPVFGDELMVCLELFAREKNVDESEVIRQCLAEKLLDI